MTSRKTNANTNRTDKRTVLFTSIRASSRRTNGDSVFTLEMLFGLAVFYIAPRARDCVVQNQQLPVGAATRAVCRAVQTVIAKALVCTPKTVLPPRMQKLFSRTGANPFPSSLLQPCFFPCLNRG